MAVNYGRTKKNWYTCFDPVGTLGNVHFLICNRPEHVAGRVAQNVADKLEQVNVTMKLLRRGNKT